MSARSARQRSTRASERSFASAAAAAWTEIAGRPPTSVELLSVQDGRFVYRLVGARGDAPGAIAKRLPSADAVVERLVYESILPHLDLAAPQLHGVVHESSAAWLLLEDIDGEPFDASRDEHRNAAAVWLARLHTGARAVPAVGAVPRRTFERHRETLGSARVAVAEGAVVARVGPQLVTVLDRVASQLAVVEGAWEALEDLWSAAPETLVHGDFVAKNLRVRRAGNRLELIALDWGSAARGSPIEDLPNADAASYATAVLDVWPELDAAVVERMAELGRILRALSWIAWDRERLASAWAADVIEHKLRFYADWLDGWLAALRTGLTNTRA